MQKKDENGSGKSESVARRQKNENWSFWSKCGISILQLQQKVIKRIERNYFRK